MSWTDEKVQKLKELWSKGHTASQIANMLGDTTRNAVIGKAHRLNLEARAPSKYNANITKQEGKISKKNPKTVSLKSKFKSIMLDKNFEAENPTSLENLTDKTCRWPIGHPDEDNFIFAVENLKENFRIVNFMFYMHFNQKDKKKNSSIKMMKFQNLLRKRSNPRVNSIYNGIYKQIP